MIISLIQYLMGILREEATTKNKKLGKNSEKSAFFSFTSRLDYHSIWLRCAWVTRRAALRNGLFIFDFRISPKITLIASPSTESHSSQRPEWWIFNQLTLLNKSTLIKIASKQDDSELQPVTSPAEGYTNFLSSSFSLFRFYLFPSFLAHQLCFHLIVHWVWWRKKLWRNSCDKRFVAGKCIARFLFAETNALVCYATGEIAVLSEG